MGIVQDSFYIPDDIETGIATGKLYRIGNVVRYACGPRKGQIVKHLNPVNLNVAEQTQVVSSSALQFVQNHKKGVILTATGTAIIGAGIFCYNKWKKHEPKVLTKFRASLRTYIDAVRVGNMDINKIDSLIAALEELKTHKNYEKISIQLTAEEMELLVEYIYDYTIKLSKDNAIVISDENLQQNCDVIINLQSYLNEQKRIFETAA